MVTGAGCSLAGAAGSTCTTITTCPAGQTAIGGGCDGFTSVAVGRTFRSGTNGWQCFYNRIVTIGNPNTIAAQAFCCP